MRLPVPKPKRIDVAGLRRFATKELQAPDDVKRQLRKAVDAYARITKRGKADPKNLKIVVDAATHRLGALWCSGVCLLAALVAEYPEAKHAVRDIMQHGKAPQRWHMIQGLPYCADVRFAQEIVAKAINDPAASVRYRAIELAMWRRFVKLVPHMEQRLNVEGKPDVRRTLEEDVNLLRQGFHVRRGFVNPREWCLVVQTHGGVTSCEVKRSDISSGHIAAIADEIQRRDARIHGYR